MGTRISQLTSAGALAGTELVELSRLSSTVTLTATTLSAQASDNSYNDSGALFVASGFAVGMAVKVTGFTGNVANNITVGVITALTTSKMTIGGTDGDVIVDDAAGESVTITAYESVRTDIDTINPGAAPDASVVTYTPAVAADWNGSADPGDVDNALDQLAERVKDIEGAGGVADDSITNAKLANVATQTIKGRTTAGTGDPEDLTAAQAAAVIQGDGLTVDLAGFRGIPQNAQTGNYTLVAADAGKHIYHASGAGAGDTYTIPANASVAFPVGTSVTFINLDASNSVSIVIATDTMYLSSAGTTGTRTLASYGVATAVKVTSTAWIISGTGLT